MLADPEAAGAVNVVEQDAIPVEDEISWHGELWKLPETPVSKKLTLPVGDSGEPAGELSETMAVQVEASFTSTGLVHDTVEVVWRAFTITEKAGLETAMWVESPL